MYYRICERCGAHLDPEERCECLEKDKCQSSVEEDWRLRGPGLCVGYRSIMESDLYRAMRHGVYPKGNAIVESDLVGVSETERV